MRSAESIATLEFEANSVQATSDYLSPIMGAVFFMSGFSSLIYEIVWMRRLSLFFGSDVYSAALTLGAFMGGLTLGSLLASRYSDRLKNPLVWYGILECLIGLYALFFPIFLNAFSGQFREVYRNFFNAEPWVYNLFRISVATITLIVPTTMMGSTLPLIVKRFAQVGQAGKCSGFFYSMNTFGALSGVLTAGFILLPNFGMKMTSWIACTLNLLIGCVAVAFGITNQGASVEANAGAAEATADLLDSELGYNGKLRRAAIVAICLSGMAALALEVVWMRLLTQSFSGAVYSFSIMLSCFLFGIFYGSRKFAEVIDCQPNPSRLFGFIELLLGTSVALLAICCYFVPSLFSTLLALLTGASKGNFGFACTVAQFLVSGLLIIVPTTLLGATFPASVRICTPSVHSIGRSTAEVYAANTAGAIVGSVLSGFYLIPVFGSMLTLVIVAGVFGATGIFLLYVSDTGIRSWLKDRQFIALSIFFLVCVVIASLLPKRIIVNFSYSGADEAHSIFHGEGTAHTVDVFKTAKGVVIMSVNGTLESDTTHSQRRHFILKADLPLLLHPNPSDVAVVGLGLGITLMATDRYPDVQRIQVIELSPEMVKAQRDLNDVSGGVLRSPKVRLRIDDGRNFLAMSDQRFDLITADPIHPRVSGVGYLYTKEYYESLKHRLKPNGVVCQWMPMYRISKKSFDVAFRTFVSVFPNASFWYVRGHGLFVATQSRFTINFKQLEMRVQDPAVKRDLGSIEIQDADELLSYMLLGPREVNKYLANAEDQTLNTDDNAYLEYHTPFEFLQTTKAIIAALIPYSAIDFEFVEDMPSENRDRLVALWNRKRADLLPELDRKHDE